MSKRDPGNETVPAHSAAPDRASLLAAAILRISDSLDPDTVLREIVEGARELTGAHLGIAATVDEAGAPADYIISGFTPDQERELEEWSGGLELVAHLHELPGPLRVADLPGYVRELGLSPPSAFPGSFQGTPVRHRGENVGYLYLGEKKDGEAFTAADEAVLMLFAAQAAAAIGNARAHRREQRARRDLEGLIETTPVGVAVFDGPSGRMKSWNREARRLAERLRMPGRPLEALLRTVAYRRADGRELSLEEVPLAEQFETRETLRAEEVAVSVPDGRNVRLLINVTPVPAEGPEAGSVVVTIQDLEPLEEIERLRTEFLGLVSHELRVPLTAIKGSAVTLLEECAELDPLETREFHRIIVEQAGHMRRLIADLLDAGRIDSGTLSVSPEPTAVAELIERARGAFLGTAERRGIDVALADGLAPVMADRRRIAQVLKNLFAHAARHTQPGSTIRVSARADGHEVCVSVADDGEGLEPGRLKALFRKHAGGASGTAGDGLALSICKGLVEAHGGRIVAESEGPGLGTKITFTLPAVPSETDTALAAQPLGGVPGKRTRIVAVDEDPNALRFVRDALEGAGYAPRVTGAPEDLGALIRKERPALLLLDLALPGREGPEWFGEIPELTESPVIFLSGYGRDETAAKALELGADDYIVKPFSPTELVTRVGAALRRHAEPEPLVLGELAIDHGARRVTLRGEVVELTATEYELLRLLSVNAGRVVHHETLMRGLRGGREGGRANLVRIYVRNLRRKLGEDAQCPTWIFSHRGVGYRMPRPADMPATTDRPDGA